MSARRARGRGRLPHKARGVLITLGGSTYVLLSYETRSARQRSLTAAENSVALAALAGYSNAEIARQRGTSSRTVANQLAGIFRKVGVRSRSQLALHWGGMLTADAS